MGRFYRTDQLTAGWSVGKSLREAEYLDKEIKRAERNRQILHTKKEKLLKLIDCMHKCFDGTTIQEPAERLISSWAQYGYNREVVCANQLVRNMVTAIDSSGFFLLRWEKAYEDFCESNHLD